MSGAGNGSAHEPTTATHRAPDISLQVVRERLRDRYAIERQLGRGGMGAVYLARDVQLDRHVAIKVLPPEFAAKAELRERFLRETRMAASFSHPNIVPVFSVEDRDELLAFAMGYVEGESLAERVKRAGPLSVKELVRLLQDVGYALAYAHGRGVVHRDIKPDNIMLERATGRALLMDFGISRTIAAPSVTQGLTRVGEVVGTPEFMSPEQASGDNVTGRSDLYSLGLVAWFAATAKLAISGESTQKVLVKQLTEIVPPVIGERSDLPRALADAIDRCLLKDPLERFATAEELVDTLDAAKLGGPDVPIPVRMFAEEASQAGLVLVGGVIMGVLLKIALSTRFQGQLDIILPVVMFAAIVWGRLMQTVQRARRLAFRGFTVAETQRGLATVFEEREAERAQLRADVTVVKRRRWQVLSLLVLFFSTFALREYVAATQRTEVRPNWYEVSPLGTLLLFIAFGTRGVAIIGLLRSPLRRPIGEWLSRLFWTGVPGRGVLRWAARGVSGVGSGRTTGAIAVTGASSPATGAGTVRDGEGVAPDALRKLEARVEALERWRDARSDAKREQSE